MDFHSTAHVSDPSRGWRVFGPRVSRGLGSYRPVSDPSRGCLSYIVPHPRIAARTPGPAAVPSRGWRVFGQRHFDPHCQHGRVSDPSRGWRVFGLTEFQQQQLAHVQSQTPRGDDGGYSDRAICELGDGLDAVSDPSRGCLSPIVAQPRAYAHLLVPAAVSSRGCRIFGHQSS